MRRVAAALLAATLAACSSSARNGTEATSAPTTVATTVAADSTTSTVASAPTTALTTTPPTSAPASTAPPTTAASVDPSYDDIPIGVCDTLTPDAIGFRNDTGAVANIYEQIGTSAQGRPIWAEHWGPTDGPQVLVLGQVHGDECAPAWFVEAIREQPPTEFGIWLVATINPDGLAAHTRRTAEDVDPNRDGFRLATPEARAVMLATERYQPMLTIHVHSPYQWIGAHNGGLAREVAQAMSDAVGWGPTPNAGRVEDGDLAFLWEGQELVIPGHPSVLIEFPAIAEGDSPAPPDLSQKDIASVGAVAAQALLMRDAFYAILNDR